MFTADLAQMLPLPISRLVYDSLSLDFRLLAGGDSVPGRLVFLGHVEFALSQCQLVEVREVSVSPRPRT